MKSRSSRESAGGDPRPATATPRRRRIITIWAIAGIAVLLGVGVLAGTWRRKAPIPPPPEVNLSGASPAMAKAVTSAREDVLNAPESGRTWGRFGMVLLAHHYQESTTFCLAQAAELEPEEFLWPYLLGVHLAVSEPEEAARRFQRAAELRPDEPLVHLRLGELLLHLERRDEAAVHLRKAVELDPDNPRAYVSLAKMAVAGGDLQTALRWAQLAVGAAPHERATCEMLALVYQRLGRRDEALQVLARAEQLPAQPLGWKDRYAAQVLAVRQDVEESLYRADVLIGEQRATEAVAVLRDALELDRGNPAVYGALVRAYLAAGDLRGAHAALDEAEQRHPRSAEIWFHRGLAFFVAGQFDEAASAFGGAIDRKPDYADAHYNLGHARLRLGAESAAEKAFRDAIRFRPDYAHAHINLAKILWNAGRRDEASEHLQISRELNPSDPEVQKLQRQLKSHATAKP